MAVDVAVSVHKLSNSVPQSESRFSVFSGVPKEFSRISEIRT